MAVSPGVLNGLLGVGAISTVGVGGVILYKNGFFSGSEHSYTKIDKLAYESTDGWSINVDPTTTTISSPNTVSTAKIIVKWTNSDTNANKSWTCNIEGTINPQATTGTLGIDEQKDSLLTTLGISGGKRTANDKFKTFFDNCINHRENDATDDSSTSTIHVRIAKDANNKYKFNDKFEKLYGETIKTEKEILKELNIEGCAVNSESDCDLAGKIINIKFKDKGDAVLTAENDSEVKLKIERTNDTEHFPEGLKFTFKISSNDTTIKKGNDSFLALKKDTNPEFRIKEENKNLVLEKAWSAKDLLSKAVTECTWTDSDQKCSLSTSSKVNFWESDNKYIIGASNSQANKKVSFSDNLDGKGYNQGFKFTADEDITLSETGATTKKPASESSVEWKLTSSNKNYEVIVKNIENQEHWFLAEKK